METSGSAMIKPASSGFLPDSHEPNAIIHAAVATLSAARIRAIYFNFGNSPLKLAS